jgi:hypothetical protein
VGNDACADPKLLEQLTCSGQLQVVSFGRDDEHAKEAAEIIKAFTGDDTQVWCDRQPRSAQHRRFNSLAVLRQMLVMSRQEPGPAGLLSNTAAVSALQELLPFATLLEIAAAGSGLSGRSLSSSSDGDLDASGSAASLDETGTAPILDGLLPVQRAWLLADAAAGLLLSAGGDNR